MTAAALPVPAPEPSVAEDARPAPPRIPEMSWETIGHLRLPLSVELPVRNFTVRDLLRLRCGSLVTGNTRCAAALPLRVREQTIATVEFEAVEEMLYARITALA